MGIPEEIDNIEPFPTSARQVMSSRKMGNRATRSEEKGVIQRGFTIKNGFTPSIPMKVEYWHQGEKAEAVASTRRTQKHLYSKRADQFGLLLLASALVVVIVVGVALYINTKRYRYATSEPNPTSTAVVNFYLGEHAFSQKVANERAAKQSEQGHVVHGISLVNDDLEVSLHDQMSSMSDKMEKMHSEKQMGEALPPAHDTGLKPELMMHLKPTKGENFQSPLEFNGALPKELQPNK